MPDRLTDERLEQYIASLPEGWTSREVAEEVLLTLANEIEHRVNVCLRMVRRL
jgi:hypothetical protein